MWTKVNLSDVCEQFSNVWIVLIYYYMNVFKLYFIRVFQMIHKN
jgi:hypothetical protein